MLNSNTLISLPDRCRGGKVGSSAGVWTKFNFLWSKSKFHIRIQDQAGIYPKVSIFMNLSPTGLEINTLFPFSFETRPQFRELRRLIVIGLLTSISCLEWNLARRRKNFDEVLIQARVWFVLIKWSLVEEVCVWGVCGVWSSGCGERINSDFHSRKSTHMREQKRGNAVVVGGRKIYVDSPCWEMGPRVEP